MKAPPSKPHAGMTAGKAAPPEPSSVKAPIRPSGLTPPSDPAGVQAPGPRPSPAAQSGGIGAGPRPDMGPLPADLLPPPDPQPNHEDGAAYEAEQERIQREIDELPTVDVDMDSDNHLAEAREAMRTQWEKIFAEWRQNHPPPAADKSEAGEPTDDDADDDDDASAVAGSTSSAEADFRRFAAFEAQANASMPDQPVPPSAIGVPITGAVSVWSGIVVGGLAGALRSRPTASKARIPGETSVQSDLPAGKSMTPQSTPSGPMPGAVPVPVIGIAGSAPDSTTAKQPAAAAPPAPAVSGLVAAKTTPTATKTASPAKAAAGPPPTKVSVPAAAPPLAGPPPRAIAPAPAPQPKATKAKQSTTSTAAAPAAEEESEVPALAKARGSVGAQAAAEFGLPPAPSQPAAKPELAIGNAEVHPQALPRAVRRTAQVDMTGGLSVPAGNIFDSSFPQ